MKISLKSLLPFLGQLPILVLASTLGIPAIAQETQPADTSQSTPSSTAATKSTPASSDSLPQPTSYATSPVTPPKEGFWGHLNPFARKNWVKKQVDPINDRLSELDEVSAKNGRDITDMDTRAQNGIHQAQSAADAANQTATAAGSQADQAHTMAQNASGHVDQLNSTVNGLDQYHPIHEVEIPFRGGEPTLSSVARKRLDDLAASLSGQQGYILEMEAQSPSSGSAGIQNSERLAEAVKRYLVTQHEIPVYRMHAVALGNARGSGDDGEKPVRVCSVHIQLMENSLAAQQGASPQGAAFLTGAERP